MLRAHPWPGNVRELVNCVESMVVMAKGPTIVMEDVPDHLLSGFDTIENEEQKTPVLADLERQAIVEALRKTGGNKMRTARMLGIGLRTLYRKMEKWGL